MFVEDFPISQLNPADYNPRKISEESKQDLEDSIAELGMVKPIIVAPDGTIIAGHQRTNALISLGYKVAPCHVLDSVTKHDEIRFNQFHNASDLELSSALMFVPQLSPGWYVISHEEIETKVRPQKTARQAQEMLKLLTKYGPFSGAVASESGEILVSAVYAHCCKTLRKPLHVCVIPDEFASRAVHYFGRSYGEFYYQHLPREPWSQAFAQLPRLRKNNGSNRGANVSFNQSEWLRGFLEENPTARVLDFGAGHGDHARKFREAGFDVTDVEFYRRVKGHERVDTGRVNREITMLCESLRTHGRFDAVICDFVLNSTDREDAERDVMNSLNAFLKIGGMAFFSGRRAEYIHTHANKSTIVKGKELWFPDSKNYTAMYSRDIWLYQKFHFEHEAIELAQTYFGAPGEYKRDGSTCWRVRTKKAADVRGDNALQGLRNEFDLPLPNGKSYGRSDDIESAWIDAMAKEART